MSPAGQSATLTRMVRRLYKIHREPQHVQEERAMVRTREWDMHPHRVTISVSALNSERDDWREFFDQYGLTLNVVMGRAIRMLIHSIRKFPHTPIARELLKPVWQSEWDAPLPEKASLTTGPINTRSRL